MHVVRCDALGALDRYGPEPFLDPRTAEFQPSVKLAILPGSPGRRDPSRLSRAYVFLRTYFHPPGSPRTHGQV